MFVTIIAELSENKLKTTPLTPKYFNMCPPRIKVLSYTSIQFAGSENLTYTVISYIVETQILPAVPLPTR